MRVSRALLALFLTATALEARLSGGEVGDCVGRGHRRCCAGRCGYPHWRLKPGQDGARGKRCKRQADERRARCHQGRRYCRTGHPDVAAVVLQPQYDTNKSGTARLTGFQATNQVSVRIRDIDKLATVLDRAIAAGANEMSGIEFVVTEQSRMLDQARDDAIADARRKAELYAKAASVKLGNVISISEEGPAAQPCQCRPSAPAMKPRRSPPASRP